MSSMRSKIGARIRSHWSKQVCDVMQWKIEINNKINRALRTSVRAALCLVAKWRKIGDITLNRQCVHLQPSGPAWRQWSRCTGSNHIRFCFVWRDHDAKVRLAGDISKWVHDVTWNDNGALLITANANGEIRFWEEKEDDKWEEFQQRGKPIKLEDHMIGSSSRTQPNQVWGRCHCWSSPCF